MTGTPMPKYATAFRRAAVVVLLSGLAAGLSGCDQGGSVPRVLAETHAKLVSVNAGGVATSPSARRQVYQGVVSTLQSEAPSLEGASQQAAYSMMGEAQAGLAQLTMLEASAVAQEAASKLSLIRILGAEFASHDARASALMTGDSGADLDHIAGEAQRVTGEIEQARVDREGVLAQIAQLNRRAQEQSDQANAIRAEEAQIRDQATRANLQERAELTERAHGVSRRAAQHERAASELLAQVEVLRPELRNAEIQLEQLRALAVQLDKTRGEIEGERTRRLEDAGVGQTAAEVADSRLAEEFEAVRELITARFETLSADAVRGYEQAISTLRRAGQGSQSGGRLALATAQQGLGDALRQRETLYEQAASVFQFVNSLAAEPGIASEASALAEQLRAEAREARDGAASAYADAAVALRSGAGRASGETRETVNNAVSTLEALAASLRGETPAEESGDTTPDAETDING